MATLRSRAAVDEAQTEEEANEIGRRTVLDQDDTDDDSRLRFQPRLGCQRGFRRRQPPQASRLCPPRRGTRRRSPTTSSSKRTKQVKALLEDGFQPIVFCRFIDTADYVARHLRDALRQECRASTPSPACCRPRERETRIANLARPRTASRVLVCTDCLSEGINLQQQFNAVLHYDLCWNPTRHEQREGRVDRFGQDKPEVRVITYYGTDNPIDGVILDVLMRKHKSIKSDLGVTVAVPGSSEQVAEALFEGALFREMTGGPSEQLGFDFGGVVRSQKEKLHQQWENARDKEKASRSRYAQHALKPELVAAEMNAVRQALGSPAEVEIFFRQAMAVRACRSTPLAKARLKFAFRKRKRRALCARPFSRKRNSRDASTFPLQDGEIYLGRTSPVVEGLAGWVLDQALDPAARDAAPVAARCGLVRTRRVSARTTLLVARFRYHLKPRVSEELTLLCEEIVPLAFHGSAQSPQWIEGDQAEGLLSARPDASPIQSLVDQQLPLLLGGLPDLQTALGIVATQRAALQLQAHERVREATRHRAKVRIEPVLPGGHPRRISVAARPARMRQSCQEL